MKAFASLSMAGYCIWHNRYQDQRYDGALYQHCDACDGSVAYHTGMAHKQGASRQEVMEIIVLAVYMGGGPAAVYGVDPPIDAQASNSQFLGASHWRSAR